MRLAEYKSIMSKYNSARLAVKLNILTQSSSIGQSWSSSKVRAFSHCMAHQKYTQGASLFAVGSVSSLFYIVISGSVTIQRELQYQMCNKWPEEHNAAGDSLFTDYHLPGNTNSKNTSMGARRVKRRIVVNMRTLDQPGQTFGEDSVLGFNLRQYAAIVTSPSLEVFAVSQQNVLTYFTGKSVCVFANIGELRLCPAAESLSSSL